MTTITSIGVINADNPLHIKFALQAMEHELNTERDLAYDLWKDGHADLAEITQQRMNTLLNEIINLLKYTKAHKQYN